jgi:hypothetical protein
VSDLNDLKEHNTENEKASESIEECFVAFLDILAFTKKVEDCNDEPDKLLCLAKKITHIQKTGNVFKDILDKLNFIVVSDSIVISIPVKAFENRTLAIFAEVLANLQYGFFIKYEFLIRGGVSIGNIYHKDNVVLGEAYLEAYNLESKVAVYPRIVISDKLLKYVNDNNLGDVNTRLNKEFTFTELCCQDKGDSLSFIDYRAYGIKVWGKDLQVHVYDWDNNLQSGTNSYKRNQKIKDDMTHSDPKIAEKNKWIYYYIYPEFRSIPSERPVTIK